MNSAAQKPLWAKILAWWLPLLITQIVAIGLAAALVASDSSGDPETGYITVFGMIIFYADVYFVLPLVATIGVIGTSILLYRRHASRKVSP